MPTPLYVRTSKGFTNTIEVNNNTKASDVIRELKNRGHNVNMLIMQGKKINGNRKIINTKYTQHGVVHAIPNPKVNRANARGNARGNANARGNVSGLRTNHRRRQNRNRNVTRVTSLLSSDYISKLKELKDQGLSDEDIKRMAIFNLQRMVETYLISALKKL